MGWGLGAYLGLILNFDVDELDGLLVVRGFSLRDSWEEKEIAWSLALVGERLGEGSASQWEEGTIRKIIDSDGKVLRLE